MTTWAQLKQRAYDLMDLDAADLLANDSEKAANAANYAMREITTKIQPIYGTHVITQRSFVNLIDSSDFVHSTVDVTKSATNAKAYYFEVMGEGSCVVKVAGATLTTVTFDTTAYTAYKGLITGTGLVEIVFTGSYYYNVKNCALYESIYGADAADIPSNTDYIAYDLATLKTDFMRFDDVPITWKSEKVSEDQYYIIDKVLYLKSTLTGEFIVNYWKMPTEITTSTADSFVIEIDYELIDMAVYMMGFDLFTTDADSRSGEMHSIIEILISRYIAKKSTYFGVTVSGGAYD